MMGLGRLSDRARFLVIVLVVVAGSASCADPADVIAPSAARQMRLQLDEVRTAVGTGDPQAARQALRMLERDVVRLRDEGLIGPAQADVILASAREVAVQLSLLPDPAPSPTPTVIPSPSPEPEGDESDEEDEEHGKSEEKGKDEEKGKGHGNDD